MTLDKLGIQGYTYTDLYNPKRLQELNTEFDEYYKTFSPEGFAVFDNYRKDNSAQYSALQVSEVLMDAAKVLEQFIAALFSIETEMKQL